VSTTVSKTRGYKSPESIRSEEFARRIRGLDAEAVYEYLDRLADQIQTLETERDELRAESDRLKAEQSRMRAELDEYEQVGGRVNDQVVQLLSQAQLVAEEMVEDVNRDARERLGHVRDHERQVMQSAVDAAGDQVRSYAHQAQAQMKTIMESFASQVEQLGEPPSLHEPDTRGPA